MSEDEERRKRLDCAIGYENHELRINKIEETCHEKNKRLTSLEHWKIDWEAKGTIIRWAIVGLLSLAGSLIIVHFKGG